jgi:hypothetical protein
LGAPYRVFFKQLGGGYELDTADRASCAWISVRDGMNRLSAYQVDQVAPIASTASIATIGHDEAPQAIK